MYWFILFDIFIFFLSVQCCDRLILTSSGRALDYHSEGLGTYRTIGMLKRKNLYKNNDHQDRYLSFTQDYQWWVSRNIMHQCRLSWESRDYQGIQTIQGKRDTNLQRNNISTVYQTCIMMNVNMLSQRIITFWGIRWCRQGQFTRIFLR